MDESDRERFKKNISERVANGGVVCPVLNCRTNGNRKLNERLQNMKDGNYFMRNKMAFSSFLPRTMDALNCSDCNLKSWNAGTTRKEREREKKSEWTMTTDSLKIRNILHTHIDPKSCPTIFKENKRWKKTMLEKGNCNSFFLLALTVAKWAGLSICRSFARAIQTLLLRRAL